MCVCVRERALTDGRFQKRQQQKQHATAEPPQPDIFYGRMHACMYGRVIECGLDRTQAHTNIFGNVPPFCFVQEMTKKYIYKYMSGSPDLSVKLAEILTIPIWNFVKLT